MESGRLCVLPNGFAVWHLSETTELPSLAMVAAHRRQRYKEILGRRTVVGLYTDELIDSESNSERNKKDDALRSYIGRLGYVFSVLLPKRSGRYNPNRLRNLLQILSCPTGLEKDTQNTHKRTEDLESRLFEKGINVADMTEFGLAGKDLGFASWNGLSYCRLADESTDFVQQIIEFEVAVHATWWQSKCLSDVLLSNGIRKKELLQHSIQELIVQYAKLKNIDATESASQRTMAEAVLTTSRLGPLIDESYSLFRMQ